MTNPSTAFPKQFPKQRTFQLVKLYPGSPRLGSEIYFSNQLNNCSYYGCNDDNYDNCRSDIPWDFVKDMQEFWKEVVFILDGENYLESEICMMYDKEYEMWFPYIITLPTMFRTSGKQFKKINPTQYTIHNKSK